MCDVSITNVVATGSPNPDQITVTVAVDECKLLAVTLDGITKTAEVLEQPVIVVDFVAGVDYDPDRFVCDCRRMFLPDNTWPRWRPKACLAPGVLWPLANCK